MLGSNEAQESQSRDLRKLDLNLLAMREAIDPALFATDLSVDLAREGVPFRDAYREVGTRLAEIKPDDVDANLANRVSAGACGALELGRLEARLRSLEGS